MTHDLVHKMITIFSILVAFLSAPLLIDHTGKINWYYFYVFIIWTIGVLYLVYFTVILCTMINCKIALRKQSELIEKEMRVLHVTVLNTPYFENYCIHINNYYDSYSDTSQCRNCSDNYNNNINNKCEQKNKKLSRGTRISNKKIYQYWESISNRDGCRLFIKSTDEEKNYIPVIVCFLLLEWNFICYFFNIFNESTTSLFNPYLICNDYTTILVIGSAILAYLITYKLITNKCWIKVAIDRITKI